MIDNPSKFPDPQFIDHIEEPIIEARIIVPNDHIGAGHGAVRDKRAGRW